MKRLIPILLCAPLVAQTERQSAIAQEIAGKAQAAIASPEGSIGPIGFASAVRPDPITGASPIDGLIASWLLDRRGAHEELLTWMEQRTELQMGAHPEVSGAGSGALKATAPRVLSVAVDMGVLSRSTNGQLVTFRGTPAGVAEAVLGWNALKRPWDRLTGSATFDYSRDTGDVAATTSQLAAWSAGFEVYNGRQPRSAEWLVVIQGGSNYVQIRERLVAGFAQWIELRDWQSDFAARLEREVDRPSVRGWIQPSEARRLAIQIATDELDLLARLSVAPTVVEALDAYAYALHDQLNGRNQLRLTPRTGLIVALDWTVLRPEGQRANWAATAIAETTLFGQGRADLTANWALHSTGAARAALELILPSSTGQASLSLSYSRNKWNRGPFEFTAQATWTALLATGMRLPISIGLARDPQTGRISPQAVVGIQLATDSIMGRTH